MILTAVNKIVTIKMLFDNNMTRGAQIGIPKDPVTGKGGLVWKTLSEVTEDDYNTLEEYFINLEKRQNNS